MRDHYGLDLQKRLSIVDTIRQTFARHGFEPLQTPSMEYTQTLLQKYGEQGDKLIFHVLDSGDIADRVQPNMPNKQLRTTLCSKALRYDLTIPLARFMAEHRDTIPLPFRRYQIQPVWRADRPQKGRYREFLQCDADVIGSSSLLCDSECLEMYCQIFTQLGIPSFTIHANSRKILQALVDMLHAHDHHKTIIGWIDKIDKIGLREVVDQSSAFLSTRQLDLLTAYLSIQGDNATTARELYALFANHPIGQDGVRELEQIQSYLGDWSRFFSIQPQLARGIDYYTGPIFEVKTTIAPHIGSLGGGGRYDNIADNFGYRGLCGVGISLGVDRICDLCEAINHSAHPTENPCILLLHMGGKTLGAVLALQRKLQAADLACFLYPDEKKLDKQFKYAQANRMRHVILLGEDEQQKGVFRVKDLYSGKQTDLPADADAQTLRNTFSHT